MEERETEREAIVWYGERGIINALVIALQARGTDGWVDVLRGVRWADGGPHDWVSNLIRVTALIEVKLAQFGDPDLILVLETNDGQRRGVFVEAKVVCYASSAMSNMEGMPKKGFNSSINGQLALRYRLAHALAQGLQNNSLVEPESLHRAYRGELADPTQKPRHLRKPEVHRILRAHGLLGLPLKNYYFIALTYDTSPYFDKKDAADTRPLLLEPDGKDAWEERRSQLGWLGYNQISPAVDGDPSYRNALRTMFRLSGPEGHAAKADPPSPVPHPGGPNVDTKNLSSFSPATQALVRDLTARARDAGFNDAVVKDGSASVSVAGTVRLKLVPVSPDGTEVVKLGIAAVEHPHAWCEEPLEPGTIKGKPFWFVELPTNQKEAIDVAEGIFQQLRARHDELGVEAVP